MRSNFILPLILFQYSLPLITVIMTLQDIPLLIKHLRNTELTNTTNSLNFENLLVYHKRVKLYVFMYNRLILSPRIERKLEEVRGEEPQNQITREKKNRWWEEKKIYKDQHGAHLRQFQELKRGGNWACQSSSKSSTNLL